MSTARFYWIHRSRTLSVRRRINRCRMKPIILWSVLLMGAGVVGCSRVAKPFARNEMSNVDRIALVINQRTHCPIRVRGDSIPRFDIERARAVKPESIVGIERLKVVPDSIQRRCPDLLREVIYITTK